MTQPHPFEQKMLDLMNNFPELRDRWDTREFEEWSISGEPSSRMKHAALEVWNPCDEWKCARFDGMRAIGVWDDHHRKAFIWPQDPFHP